MVEDRRAREYRQHQWMTQHDALDGAFSLLLSYQGFPPAIHLRHLKAASRGPLHMVQAFTDSVNPDQPRGSSAGLIQGP